MRAGIPATRGGQNLGAAPVDLMGLELLLNLLVLPTSLPNSRAKRAIMASSAAEFVIFCPIFQIRDSI
jgi:hypothetical protein